MTTAKEGHVMVRVRRDLWQRLMERAGRNDTSGYRELQIAVLRYLDGAASVELQEIADRRLASVVGPKLAKTK